MHQTFINIANSAIICVSQKTSIRLTFPDLADVVSKISPLGSFVLNLNEIMLCLVVSHGGNIYMKNNGMIIFFVPCYSLVYANNIILLFLGCIVCTGSALF